MMRFLRRFFTGDTAEREAREHDQRVDANIRNACAALVDRLETWDDPLAAAARRFLQEFARPTVTRGELDRAATDLLSLLSRPR